MCSFISEAHCVHGSFTDSAVNVLRTETVTLMSVTLILPSSSSNWKAASEYALNGSTWLWRLKVQGFPQVNTYISDWIWFCLNSPSNSQFDFFFLVVCLFDQHEGKDLSTMGCLPKSLECPGRMWCGWIWEQNIMQVSQVGVRDSAPWGWKYVSQRDCALWGGWNPKQTWDLNSGTLLWHVGISRGVLMVLPNICHQCCHLACFPKNLP